MTHKFVVNTENVNEYGYRILTSGIDTVQYMRNPVVLFGHERALYSNPQAIIGKVVKLYVEDTKLIADIEFDESDAYAKKIAKKVESGFIRMASIFADVIEGSIDPMLVLPGQTHETITKCKLVEISIVDIGGNDEALKLSRNGAPIKLKKIEPKINNDMSLKTIALALSLTDTATDVEVLKEINALKLAKQTAEDKANALEKNIKDIQVVDAETLTNKAIELGLFPEALKASQLKAFETNFEEQKAVLSKIISDKEAKQSTDATHQVVKEVVLSGRGKKPVETNEQSFDYLQKHNVLELKRIKEEEPAKYAQLAKDYANGKRYIAN